MCEDCGDRRDDRRRIGGGDEVMISPYHILDGAVVHEDPEDAQLYVPFCRGNVLLRSVSNFVFMFWMMEVLQGGEDSRDLAISRWCLELLGDFEFYDHALGSDLWKLNAIFLDAVRYMKRGESLL